MGGRRPLVADGRAPRRPSEQRPPSPRRPSLARWERQRRFFILGALVFTVSAWPTREVHIIP